MAYTLAWEAKGVYWNYSGNVSGQEIIHAVLKFMVIQDLMI